MPSGYSGTPLVKKLGIKPGFKLLLYNVPEYYYKLLEIIPSDFEVLSEPKLETADFIHLFCISCDELKSVVATYKYSLKKNGMMWVSWPKGASGISTDINRDIIREYILNTGLVDIKVASIDETWSGLKFTYRIQDR